MTIPATDRAGELRPEPGEPGPGRRLEAASRRDIDEG